MNRRDTCGNIKKFFSKTFPFQKKAAIKINDSKYSSSPSPANFQSEIPYPITIKSNEILCTDTIHLLTYFNSFYKSFTIFILASPPLCNNCTISGVSCTNYCVGRGFHCSPAGGVGGTCIYGGGNSCISPGINYCINGAGIHVGCDAPYGNYTCCC